MVRPGMNAQVPQSGGPARTPLTGEARIFYQGQKAPPISQEPEVFPFRTIGPYLGLGKVKALQHAPSAEAANGAKKLPHTHPAPNRDHDQLAPHKPAPNHPGKVSSTKHGVAPAAPLRADRKPRAPRTHRGLGGKGWVREFLVTGLSDLFLVLISLWVLFTFALVIAAFTEPKGIKSGIEHWLSLRPVAFLAALKPWVGGVGILGIYFCYVLTFRIFVGQTLGRSFSQRRQTGSQQGIGPRSQRRHSL